MAPWIGERRSLLTFDERGGSLRSAFTAPVADRLAAVTRSYDPTDCSSPATSPAEQRRAT